MFASGGGEEFDEDVSAAPQYDLDFFRGTGILSSTSFSMVFGLSVVVHLECAGVAESTALWPRRDGCECGRLEQRW
jgi:hypothetical protein